MAHEISPPAGVRLFGTPEEAALAQWDSTPGAHAHVIAIDASPDANCVFVTIETDATSTCLNRDIATCRRTSDGRWWESASAGA